MLINNGCFETQPIAFSGGDGSSFEQAIVILGATGSTGVDAEYVYLNVHFPGFALCRQRLCPHNSRNYDVLEFMTPDGRELSVYFDITSFLPV